MYATLASAAIMATSAALAQSVGSAIVINKCSYPVTLCNVPAADGGFSEIDKTLQPEDKYTQDWTELSNAQGWSIKLSQDTSLSNILQYEYTFHNDGIIWYDLSEVNGNPWDGNWEITAESPSSVCAPKQQAYRYATDDAYGMQSCASDAVITVTLCSGDESNDGPAASASSSVAAESSSIASATSISAYSTPSSAAPESTTVAPETTTSVESVASTTPVSSTPASSTPTSTGHNWRTHSWHQANAAATTLATSTIVAPSTTTAPGGEVTVVNVETAVVTEIVTATQYAKRHPHHPRHGRA